MQLKRRAFLFCAAALVSISGCNLVSPEIVHFINYPLKDKKNILLNYSFAADGLYDRPFIIDFGEYLNKMSGGQVNVDAVNTYTVGGYDPAPGCPFHIQYSNFLNPACKFANSWFGVYFIFDDAQGRARRFLLKDPAGNAADFANFKQEALARIPELDQKLIVWSTHENQENYSWDTYQKEFFFNELVPAVSSVFRDGQNREWLRLRGSYDTIAAFTDITRTKMSLRDSLRSYIGLPNAKLYELVDPWYRVAINGSLFTARYECRQPFWAVVYYNGSAFTMKNGQKVDTMASSDLEKQFQRMINGLQIQCE